MSKARSLKSCTAKSKKWCQLWKPTFLDTLDIIESYPSEKKIEESGPKEIFNFY